MTAGPDDPRRGPRPWSQAWSRRDGFWRSGPGLAGPAAHFRTATHVGPGLGDALLELLREVDARLGRPATLDVVDVGAGGGELLAALVARAETTLRERLRPLGVDLLPRPGGLDPSIGWVQGEAPSAVPVVRGLLVAHEWLDELPLDVVAIHEGEPRTVLVDDDGTESLGPPPSDAVRAWCARWWPTGEGDRAECGLARDRAWAECVARLEAGTALAIDYGHVREDREAGRYAAGTLSGYRDGVLVAPRPDGSTNLTAHVAVDAVAAALDGFAGTAYPPVRQRDALRALGISGSLPDAVLAARDPGAYAEGLERASQASELLDPAGLGAFWWLRHDV
ncbi:MAG TPA: SAM-dependent methyltransferase [Candidatus Nanopelagicales bacterium]|nr:SAM-dependent methyltransferase [Candidatus Nanopelagicales bacterium]